MLKWNLFEGFDRVRPILSQAGPAEPAVLANNAQTRAGFLIGLFLLAPTGVFATEPSLWFFANTEAIHQADERIRVNQVTPSSDILFFGDSWIRKNSVSRLVQTLEIVKSNKIGRANLNDIDLVVKAIWCAVDLLTGAYVFDSVNSSAGTLLEVTQAEILQFPKSITINARQSDMVILRPGQTAWVAQVADGGPTDGGASQDGKVQVDFETFEFLWSQGASAGMLGGLSPGDVILGINPDDMTYFALQIGVAP